MNWRRVISFRRYRFEVQNTTLGAGGQGMVFRARRKDDRTRLAVLKTMPAEPATHTRLHYLAESELGYQIPRIAAPLAWSQSGSDLNYIAPLAQGIALDEDPVRSFPELLELAWQLACLWSRFEDIGFAHGDVAPSNILIAPDGQITLIDIDNFVAQDPFAPKPTMIGQHPVIAPELREARNAGSPVPPTLESDRFAWAVILSFLIFGRHPTDGLTDGTPASFDREMATGAWPESRRTLQPGETPVAAIGPDLAALFESGFSRRPDQRPTATTWRIALGKALLSMTRHKCGQVFVGRASNTCPWCGRELYVAGLALTTKLRNLSTGEAATFNLVPGALLTLGRNNIPGASARISRAHLQLCIRGNDLRITNLGRNGTTITLAGRAPQPLKTISSALPCAGLNHACLTLGPTELELTVT